MRRILTQCTVLAFVAAAASAQSPVLSTSPNSLRTPLAKDPSQLADPLLLFATGPGPAVPLPGAAGSLSLDLGTLQALPGFPGFGPTLVPLLRSLPKSSFSYQTLMPGTKVPILSDRADVSLGADFQQQDGLEKCRERAQLHIDSVSGDLAPNWKQAAIAGPARAFYRPDVRGVAYYEFAVQPAGFVVVSTGVHDHPVAHWNNLGSSIARDLEAIAAKTNSKVAKLYKLDTLCYVAVDANGKRIATIGSLPPKLIPDSTARGGYSFGEWSSFAELRAGFAAAYKPLIENLRGRAAPQWLAERGQPVYGPADWSPWTYNWAGTHEDQRLYWQFDFGSCKSGCGPTAWAMLFGWVDLKASRSDPRWWRQAGIYRSLGSTSGNSAVVAPRYQDTGVRNMTLEIRRQVATFCLGSSGATFPWDMDQCRSYLNARTNAFPSTHYNVFGIHEGRLREKVQEQIQSFGTPGIIGTGWLNHYPLAYGFAQRFKQIRVYYQVTPYYGYWTYQTVFSRWFFVNQGWGGSGNGWIDASSWFSGRIFPG